MSSLYLETLPDEKLLSELNDCILNERYFDAIGVGSIIELAVSVFQSITLNYSLHNIV